MPDVESLILLSNHTGNQIDTLRVLLGLNDGSILSVTINITGGIKFLPDSVMRQHFAGHSASKSAKLFKLPSLLPTPEIGVELGVVAHVLLSSDSNLILECYQNQRIL